MSQAIQDSCDTQPRSAHSVEPTITGQRDQADNAKACSTGERTLVAPLEHSALQRDSLEWGQAKPSPMQYLLHASSVSGRSPLSLAFEFAQLKRGKGRLTLPEYVQYGVYQPSISWEDKQRFLTNTMHWPIVHQCCDMTWQATTEDKWLCSRLLEQSDVATPPTLAVIDRTGRSFPGTRKITNCGELREFALAQQGQPLFGKQIRGICGWGAFLVLDADSTHIHLKGEGWIDYETFLESFVGSTSYLLQPCQRNHPFFDSFTDNLATVRVCVLLTDHGIHIPFSVLKLPAHENIVDSFWRPGNLACDLDPQLGTIVTARGKSALGTTDHKLHPRTAAPLVGETVPKWRQLLQLVEACSPIFAPVRYQSMDIAVTSDGPMLIEINTGGGFDLPQLASGRGFLTDEVREFFSANNIKNL